MKNILFVLLFGLMFLASCNSKPDVLAQFKSEDWSADKWGCNGQRKMLVSGIVGMKESLKGQTADYITAHLGHPDEKDIVNRQQKYFRYYMSSPSHCNSKEESFLQFRINSVNLVDEIVMISEF